MDKKPRFWHLEFDRKFDFSHRQYFDFWLVIFFGSMVLIFGFFVAKKMSPKTHSTNYIDSQFLRQNLGYFLFFWFVVGATINILMIKLGIGQHTVSTTIHLPLKLHGVMVYYRDCVHILLLGFLLSFLANKND